MENNRLERIEVKIDKLSDHLAKIDVTLASQHVSLEEHMRRTSILETKLEPVENHVQRIAGVLKLAKVVAMFLAIAEAVKVWLK